MTTTSERTTEQGLACCSIEAGKTCCKGPGISRSLLGGFVGTVGITMKKVARIGRILVGVIVIVLSITLPGCSNLSTSTQNERTKRDVPCQFG